MNASTLATEAVTDRSGWQLSALIAETIAWEMRRDPSVLCIGEDIGRAGGVFGATRGLLDEFGAGRIMDAPIAEMAFAGMGVGLAQAGMRPLVELMFVDFLGVCLEQIFNAAAKIPYMSGGRQKMPIVFKTAGGCIGSAAQHSQCLWGLFAHLPGLKVVAPSNPFDYRGLLTSAIRSDDPVIYIEHKGQLLKKLSDFRNNTPIPDRAYTVPFGRAVVLTKGRDVTLATLSSMVEHALEAALVLEQEGISVEVVDLRTVVPLDHDTVARSAARTGRLLVVDEDYLSFGLSAELCMRVIEQIGPGALRQVERLAVPDVPVPAALALERKVVPGVDMIIDRVRTMAKGA
ncbi:thiamine pyrophosphate-dependent dehydrogenase E1 component subunit beta [Gluconacetobacter sacchari DSM 12717]|uniref:Alpha-ketoacid dehydrogenase subunit beta n=2 Tax=Gluconacetobacter sacchari TaxID=92759 RepID=A0A7W4NS67_9PROT|nr:transketolase C-terminal domain-containing protein [Gluconacetobacter sacchari]MBB2161773.1 alpha-ketoacid dehydrogenase subunit beta [Gluconacetobacter sacchari]GBQ20087.1 thiamine pyrophosphate-dependent dehydrogenase E1 component subunit beta [Gluconacetobacter sacchari DSM 12717]